MDQYQSQIVLFSDIKLHLKAIKGVFLFIISFCLMLGCVFFLVKEPRYIATATFKEAGVKASPSGSNLLKNILLSGPASQEGGVQAVSIMKSRLFLSGLIDELGLRIVEDEISLMNIIQRRAVDRLQLFFTGNLSDQERVVIECSQDFSEEFLHGVITPINPTEFVLQIGSRTYKATLGQWINCSEGKIKVLKFKHMLPWKFRVLPMEEMVEKVNKRLKIKSKKDDSNILDLKYEHRDRFLAARFLNQLMAYYKEYLAKDSERISQEQLSYLAKRQEEIALSVEDTFKHHAHYLKDNLDERGYISIQDEIHVKEGLKKEIDEQLDRTETLIGSLKNLDFSHPTTSILDEKLEELIERWRKIHEEEQSYLASKLKQSEQRSSRSNQKSYKVPFLAEKNSPPSIDINTLKTILEEKVRKPLSELFYLTRLHEQIGVLIKMTESERIKDNQTLKEVIHLANLDPTIEFSKEHLERLQSLVDLKLSSMKQRLFKAKPTALEHDHLNLETAKELFFDYTHELDAAELKTKQLDYCLLQIHQNTFEASILPPFLTDSVTLELIAESAKLQKQLKDPHYFSSKDHQRMDKSIKKEKNALFQHLTQIKNLLVLEKELCLEKMGSLQDLMLMLLQEEKSLIHKQLKDYVHSKIAALENNQKLLEERLKKLYENMVDIPQMWVKEQILELKKKLNISMMEAMTQLIESKNVDLHFTQVESKPLDLAYTPLKPKNEHEVVIVMTISMLMGFFYLGVSSLKKAFQGLSISLEGLEYRSYFCVHEFKNQKISSEWGSLSPKVLEGIRKIGGFLLPKQFGSSCVGVFLNQGQDYVHHLARLLALSEKKVLIIPLGTRLQDVYQKIFQIESLGSRMPFDVWLQKNLRNMIPEMMVHPSTIERLEQFKKSYDLIILLTDEGPSSATAQRIMPLVDQLIIKVSGETLEDLNVMLKWAEGKSVSSLCFLRET